MYACMYVMYVVCMYLVLCTSSVGHTHGTCSMYYLGILFYFTERCGVVIQYMYYPSVLHVQ